MIFKEGTTLAKWLLGSGYLWQNRFLWLTRVKTQVKPRTPNLAPNKKAKAPHYRYELASINISRIKFSRLLKKPQNQQKFSPLENLGYTVIIT